MSDLSKSTDNRHTQETNVWEKSDLLKSAGHRHTQDTKVWETSDLSTGTGHRHTQETNVWETSELPQNTGHRHTQETHIFEALELLSSALLPLTAERVRGTWDSKAEASVPSMAARSIRCSFRAGPHSGRGFVSLLAHWAHNTGKNVKET